MLVRSPVNNTSAVGSVITFAFRDGSVVSNMLHLLQLKGKLWYVLARKYVVKKCPKMQSCESPDLA